MAARAPQDRRPKKTPAPADAANGAVAHICGQPVTVPHPDGWRQTANDALTEGRYNEWAVRVLARDDAITWYDLDPTNAEVAAFFDEAYEALAAAAAPSDRARLDALRLRRRR